MRGSPRLVAAVTALVLLVLYFSTLAPGLAGGDSPEMITAACVVGIPHQPGYPLYVLAGRVVSLAPIGSVAARINAVSAITGAAACGVLCAIMLALGVSASRAGRVSAAAIAVALGASWPIWSQAVVAEVYAPGLLLGLLAIFLVHQFLRSGALRSLLVAAYVGGLALSHQPLAVLLLPGALFVVLSRLWRERSLGMGAAGRALAPAALLFVLPFTAFLLLPIRSGVAPIDYAQISGVGDFLRHVLGLESRSELLSEGGEGIRSTLALMGSFVTSAAGPGTPILILSGLAGIVVAARRDVAAAVLLGLPLALGVGFALVYAIVDVENYLLFPLVLLVALGAVGLARLPGRAEWPAAIVLVLVALFSIGANRARCDRSDYHLVDDFVRNTYRFVPPNGALFLLTEVLAGPFVHETLVVRARLDVRLVDMTGKVLPNDLGFRSLTGDWLEARWRRMEALWESPPPGLVGRRFVSFLNAPRVPEGKPYHHRRRGLVFELAGAEAPSPLDPAAAYAGLRIRLPRPELVRADRTAFSLTPRILDLYARLATEAAYAHLGRGEHARAEVVFREIMDFRPRSVEAREGLALAASRASRLGEAERWLREALEIQPDGVQGLNALGVLLRARGATEEAEAVFRRALAVDAGAPLTRLNLGLHLAESPSPESRLEARENLEAFLRLAPEDPDAPRARAVLESMAREPARR